MPFIQRYSDVKKGGIVFTGNTLGLSKITNQTAAGTLGSIGAFISLNPALQVATFPAGTTLNYTQNGSRAILNLPSGSTVLYAELVWGGLFRSSVNNISALINNNVTFTTPLGAFSIAPDPATAQDFNIPANNITVGFYVRTANVTTLVQSSLGGTYSVEGVPALIEAIDSRTADTNHAGWTLAVVYENPNQTLRNLTLWSGGAVVSPDTGSTTITVLNFLTPDVLPITGKIFVSAQEGDAVLTGDTMLFGQSIPTLEALSGPNNPEDNFFVSQINDSDGLLDTSGTFGTRNANAAAGTNTSACRQGWDITAVDVSDKLVPNQTSAVIRFTSDGDLYVPNALALQIDSKGANLVVTKSADKTTAEVGEVITYTLQIENTGTVEALNTTITDFLPPETTLVPNSITVDGVPYAGALPVQIATIAPNQTVTVTFQVTANSIPAMNPILNIARADYNFFPFSGFPATSFSLSNQVAVLIVSNGLTNVKSVDKAFAEQGDTLHYTSVITNTGTQPKTDMVFNDPIPAGTTFTAGSVKINGTAYPAYNPQIGFALPDLAVGGSVIIEFDVIITAPVNTITNFSNVSFVVNEQPVTVVSNPVITIVNSPEPDPIITIYCPCKCCNCRQCNCCLNGRNRCRNCLCNSCCFRLF
ncbi:MAG: DUF11 domain-containing protein [Clostridia bacterium]|nr:DUF11 domain-containing protein [Clostridia bacterium]